MDNGGTGDVLEKDQPQFSNGQRRDWRRVGKGPVLLSFSFRLPDPEPASRSVGTRIIPLSGSETLIHRFDRKVSVESVSQWTNETDIEQTEPAKNTTPPPYPPVYNQDHVEAYLAPPQPALYDQDQAEASLVSPPPPPPPPPPLYDQDQAEASLVPPPPPPPPPPYDQDQAEASLVPPPPPPPPLNDQDQAEASLAW
nr:formin-like protein 3 [Oncorhynchus nerka]